jgi:hypothetical protein
VPGQSRTDGVKSETLTGYVDSGRLPGNPEAEATLQRQRGLVLPNAAVFTDLVCKHSATKRTYLPEARFGPVSVLSVREFDRVRERE